MAEHGVRYPLWERLPLPGGGFGDPVDGLPGMSASLGDRLREWNAQLEHLAITDLPRDSRTWRLIHGPGGMSCRSNW